MIATKRQSEIVSILTKNETMSVGDLALRFDVSQMTIRRDLDKLESYGILQRRHGGAVISHMIQAEEEYQKKVDSNITEKLKIAKKAAELVLPGSSIYLDTGTTTYTIATLIKDISNLTVITNDITIASYLSKTNVSLIICGGQVQSDTGSVLGQTAVNFLNSMRVNISFVGTSCVDKDFDLLTPTIDKAYMKRAAINIAQKVILVTDKSKFNKQALYKVANLADFDGVITEKKFSNGEVKAISAAGIKIINPSKED